MDVGFQVDDGESMVEAWTMAASETPCLRADRWSATSRNIVIRNNLGMEHIPHFLGLPERRSGSRQANPRRADIAHPSIVRYSLRNTVLRKLWGADGLCVVGSTGTCQPLRSVPEPQGVLLAAPTPWSGMRGPRFSNRGPLPLLTVPIYGVAAPRIMMKS